MGLIAMICFECFPLPIIRIFGSENELYNEFAVISFRVFLCTIALCCVQKACSIFLQSLGKPMLSMSLSLLRDFILSVPLTLILPRYLGVTAPSTPAPLRMLSPLRRRYSACAACSGSLERRRREREKLRFPGIGFACVS